MKIQLKIFLLKWFTIPAFMSFKTDDNHGYRITGYYYRYIYKDGTISDPYPCKRSDSNCIGGYGVCGSYTFFKKVKSISLRINKARLFFFKQYLNKSEKQYIKNYQKKVTFLKSLPKKLSQKEYEEIVINRSVDAAMKNFN